MILRVRHKKTIITMPRHTLRRIKHGVTIRAILETRHTTFSSNAAHLSVHDSRAVKEKDAMVAGIGDSNARS